MRRLLLLLCMSVMLVHCALPRPPSLRPSDFTGEIQKYRTTAKNAVDPSVRATAHYRLALLYSHHNNPSPDYSSAIKELETFIALDPKRGNAVEVKDRLALLQEIEKSTSENRRLFRENRELKNSVEQLTGENRNLKDTLEKMERLDIMIEEKRKKQLR